MSMGTNSVDASNACIPPSHPLLRQALPLPSTTRGVPLFLDGNGGRHGENDDRRRPLIMYGFGKLVIIREIRINDDADDNDEKCVDPTGTKKSTGGFVYRGHVANVTCAKFSNSGNYVASCDIRGKLRIWSYDHAEHLVRLDVQLLSGPIRDVCWDMEDRRLVVAGDGGMGNSECSKVIMWDTGVKCGELACHARKRSSSCAFRPTRPMRIATGGSEDATVYFHSGPPFRRLVPEEGEKKKDDDVAVVDEKCHERGAVHCLRYNRDGSLLASVGTDGSAYVYDGKSMKCLIKLIRAHDSSIYSCSWDRNGERLLTCGADGCVRLHDGNTGKKVRKWDVASHSSGKGDGVPVSAMQLGCAFVKGNTPVSVGYDGRIAVLPLDDIGGTTRDDSVVFIDGHKAPISAMAFGPSGTNTVYTSDTDGVVIEWDGSTGRARGRVTLSDEDVDGGGGAGGGSAGGAAAAAAAIASGGIHAGANVTSLAFVANDGDGGCGTLYSAGWDDRVRTTYGRICRGGLRMEAQPNAMAVGSRLVAVMTVGGLYLVENGRLVTDMIRLQYTATCVCMSRDDAILYVGGDDRNVHAYAISRRIDGGIDLVNPPNEVHVISGGHLHPVQSLSLSPDGTMLAAADARDVCVYSTIPMTGSDDAYPTLISKGRWCFHTQRIGCLAWSPDGSVIASGGNDDSIFLWCPMQKTKRVHYRFAHRGGVTGLGFVGKGDGGPGGDWTLVSAGADGCINWWSVEDDVREKFGL